MRAYGPGTHTSRITGHMVNTALHMADAGLTLQQTRTAPSSQPGRPDTSCCVAHWAAIGLTQTQQTRAEIYACYATAPAAPTLHLIAWHDMTACHPPCYSSGCARLATLAPPYTQHANDAHPGHCCQCKCSNFGKMICCNGAAPRHVPPPHVLQLCKYFAPSTSYTNRGTSTPPAMPTPTHKERCQLHKSCCCGSRCNTAAAADAARPQTLLVGCCCNRALTPAHAPPCCMSQ